MTTLIFQISRVQQMSQVSFHRFLLSINNNNSFLTSIIFYLALPCSTNGVRRFFIRFNYYSTDNTIASVEIYALLESTSTSPANQRLTIQWNDISTSSSSATTIPRMC